MAKLTLNDYGTLVGLAAAVNANNALVETAMENTLSRDGTTPNQMTASLDMNSNRIINLPEPASSADAVRKADLDAKVLDSSAFSFATQVEAEAGTAADKVMSPLRTAQHVTSAISAYNSLQFENKTDAAAATISSSLDFVRVAGYAAAGDGGGGLYKRVVSEPSHAGKFTSADGAFWELVDERIDPRQFNAGLGGADDTTGLNAFFVYVGAKSKVANLPKLAFTVTASVAIPDNVTVHGNGATFDCSSSHFKAFTLGAGVEVFNLELTGPNDGTYNSAGFGIACEGTNNSPSAPTYKDGLRVEGCKIVGFGYAGVWMAYVKNAKVFGNRINNCGYVGVGGVSTDFTEVEHNTIHTITPGTASDMYGVFLDHFELGTETAYPRAKNCSISFNTIYGVNWEAIDTHAGTDFRIIGNDISTCKNGIRVVPSVSGGIGVRASSRVTIDDNIIRMNGNDGEAITLAGAINGSTVVAYAQDCVIGSGNVIEGGGVAGTNTLGAILMKVTERAVVNIGTITRPKVFGVCLMNDNLDFKITGGTITDPYDNSISITAGVGVRSINNTGYIGGIQFIRDNSGLGTYVAPYSVYVSGSLTGLDISVGDLAFTGITSTTLQILYGSAGARSVGTMTAHGTVNVAVVNTGANGISDVVFDKIFPGIPRPAVQITSDISGGGKASVYRITNKANTGFRIIAYPYDLGTYSASATLTLDWTATL